MKEKSKIQSTETHCREQSEAGSRNGKPFRIGLALSGGGFRASIFHLGVIRRLEELGIMKQVHTISAVSGGAIIAAYYVIEMEKRLRKRREGLDKCPDHLDKVRLEIFEEIAACFFEALDHNLRSRALVFRPFYHPLLFIKSLWPGFSRSDIMQKEFDNWFYHDATLDDLPNVPLPHDRHELAGPTVVLNATSLLTGNRVGFERKPVSRLAELQRQNRNVLKLSRVVGASSGVPGVFAPTTILGDKLVDGGVADNQGLDALVNLDRLVDRFLDGQIGGKGTQSPKGEKCRRDDENPCNEEAMPDPKDFDFLLVSDASRQMEVKHRPGIRTVTVLSRVMSIFQFQLRRRLLRMLRWRERSAHCRSDRKECHTVCKCRGFAFVHLLLNLKGRPCNPPRVPCEYIPELGRIRTDLDQFSPIEREALMYHGYTLIDSQIKKSCKRLLQSSSSKANRSSWQTPPLFLDGTDSSGSADKCMSETKVRKRVKEVLAAGSVRLFIVRSWRKYRWKSWWVFGPALLLLLDGLGGGAVGSIVSCCPDFLGVNAGAVVQGITDKGFVPSILDWIWPWVWRLVGCLSELLPPWVLEAWNTVCTYFSVPPEHVKALASVAWVFFWVYFVLFLTYWAMRRMVRRWDLKDYRSLTGQEPKVRWTTDDARSKA